MIWRTRDLNSRPLPSEGRPKGSKLTTHAASFSHLSATAAASSLSRSIKATLPNNAEPAKGLGFQYAAEGQALQVNAA